MQDFSSAITQFYCRVMTTRNVEWELQCNNRYMLRFLCQGYINKANLRLIIFPDSQSLIDEPIRYDAATCSEDSDTETEKENYVATKGQSHTSVTARTKKYKVI